MQAVCGASHPTCSRSRHQQEDAAGTRGKSYEVHAFFCKEVCCKPTVALGSVCTRAVTILSRLCVGMLVNWLAVRLSDDNWSNCTADRSPFLLVVGAVHVWNSSFFCSLVRRYYASGHITIYFTRLGSRTA